MKVKTEHPVLARYSVPFHYAQGCRYFHAFSMLKSILEFFVSN